MAGFLDPSKKVNYKKYIMKTSQIQIQDEAFRGWRPPKYKSKMKPFVAIFDWWNLLMNVTKNLKLDIAWC